MKRRPRRECQLPAHIALRPRALRASEARSGPIRDLVGRCLQPPLEAHCAKSMTRLIYALLCGALALAAVVAGCAKSSQNVFESENEGGPLLVTGGTDAAGNPTITFGGDGGGGTLVGPPPTTGMCATGIVSISVSPPTTMAQVTYGASSSSQAQQFKATGTYPDGGTADVTDCVGWNTSDP